MSTTTVEKLIVEIRQTFPVSRERLFAAWTNPDETRQWFGPECGHATDIQMDVRTGGRYSVAMTCDGNPVMAIGEYREVTPPSRLVFTWQWKDDEDWDTIGSEITIEFNEKPDGTEMHFVQVGFPSADSRDNHNDGWSESFVKLGSFVQG